MDKKVIVIGAEGLIGAAVVTVLEPRFSIVKVGKTSGERQCDMTDCSSIEKLFEAVGPFDALVCAAGGVHFAPLEDMTNELFQIGLRDKLMGQVNLVQVGMRFINDRGSFTLTSGILSDDPIRSGCSASMVNGALDAFVKAAAIELPRGLRINAVSPTVVLEAMPKYGPYFRGFEPVPVNRAALAYSKSVEGLQTGHIYKVG